ncbi:MAG: metalloregulator ArsR/SmtB family transcription factor [Desulfosarcinaceae bacterium]|nr:metalloregulator ArsR/SmtB family transcription factor [Desulfosarcinaceae bacterium]
MASDPQQLNLVFSALADPTRRRIVERLAAGQRTAGDLAEPFGISKPAISRHLKILERAGLILRHRSAQRHLFELSPAALDQAARWIRTYRHFWEAQLDALGRFIDPSNTTDPKRG